MKTPKIIKGQEFAGYPLLQLNGHKAEYREDILLRIKERLEVALSQNSQCLVVRLVVRYPSEVNSYADNGCFCYFIEEYRRALGEKLIHYVWAREQVEGALNQHWHLILFLDGNLIRYYKSPEQANYYWNLALKVIHSYYAFTPGLIEVCHGGWQGIPMNHGMMVHRDNKPLQDEVFRLCSYLAKTATKGNAPEYVREYGASLIKKSN